MAAQGGRFRDLRVRVLSAAVLGGAAALMLWLGGIWAAALVATLAAAMAWEWRAISADRAGLAARGLTEPGAPIVAAGAAGAVLLMELGGPVAGLVWLGGTMAVLGLLDLGRGRTLQAVWGLLGLALTGLSAMAFLGLRGFEPHGLISVIWIVLVVAGADIGGYFAGRLIGGPKLWPAVSPGKTWAGLCGGIALAFFGGGLFSWATTGTYYEQVCAVSAFAALLAQAGDLGESAFKRHFGVKDSGTLIPGHGGALDRFDGLMAATLVAAAVTYGRGQTVFIW